MSEQNGPVKLQAAAIGAPGGLVAGLVTVVISHFSGLETNRQDLLEEARRDAYVEWLAAPPLGLEESALPAAGETTAADSVKALFDRTGRGALGRIAIYGSKAVVEEVAAWLDSFDDMEACGFSSWREDLRVYQAMRASLLPGDQAVSYAVMSLIVLECSAPQWLLWGWPYVPLERLRNQHENFNAELRLAFLRCQCRLWNPRFLCKPLPGTVTFLLFGG